MIPPSENNPPSQFPDLTAKAPAKSKGTLTGHHLQKGAASSKTDAMRSKISGEQLVPTQVITDPTLACRNGNVQALHSIIRQIHLQGNNIHDHARLVNAVIRTNDANAVAFLLKDSEGQKSFQKAIATPNQGDLPLAVASQGGNAAIIRLVFKAMFPTESNSSLFWLKHVLANGIRNRQVDVVTFAIEMGVEVTDAALRNAQTQPEIYGLLHNHKYPEKG